MKKDKERKMTQRQVQSINNHLKSLVLSRAKHIEFQNKQLRDCAFFNAHKIRGPLARIIGIVELMGTQPEQIEPENLIGKLRVCSKELDMAVHEISKILEIKSEG